MDPEQLRRTLNDLRQERTEAENRLAALQRHVDAVRKAADGIEELLASEPESPTPSKVDVTAELLRPPKASVTLPGGRTARGEKPTGGTAALIVLQSDATRYWTAREVWEEQVKLSWTEPTEDARAAVRVALRRLRKREPRVQFLDGPTYAYRWDARASTDALALSNGSGQRESEK